MTADADDRLGMSPGEAHGVGSGATVAVAGCRPMRADAVKNRAAHPRGGRDDLRHRGRLAVPIDTVAERAGLGVGTLYRHFPTKEALFEAIVAARLE